MNETLQQLFKKEIVFQNIVEKYGFPTIVSRPQGFESLCKLIIEQQVSLASAKACYLKMEQFLGKVTPQNIIQAKEEDLRSNSVSRQKAVYLKALSEAIESKSLPLEFMSSKTEAEISKELTKIKGIGNWTAEVYMMFCLEKKDVFPLGDIALQNTMKELFLVTTNEEMLLLAENWRPHRTLVTHLLWHYYLCKRNRKPLVY